MEDEITPIRKAESLTEAGGPVDECRATLAIYGDDLNPDVVSGMLGCSPSHAHRQGDRKSPTSPAFKTGAWLLTVETKSPNGPQEAISALLARFPATSEFWQPIVAKFRVSVRVGIHTVGWNRGFGLSPEILNAVGGIGAGIGFDLYFYGEETDGGV